MKIAIVTDSNSGITQQEGKTEGIFVLPMPFHINGQTFFEDITLSQEEFYEFLRSGAEISTSQPSPKDVMDLWDQLLKEYDQVVHIPMSSGLSGSCQTAMMLAEDGYTGRVFVVNNQRISVTQRQSALDAQAMAQKGLTGEEIKRVLEEHKYDSSIYIMLDTLFYLKKGGRITPAAAALGTILRLKPVLQIQGEKLDAFAKARTVRLAKNIMIEAVKKDIAERFGGITDAQHIHLYIAHTENEAGAEELRQELEQIFPGISVYVDTLSLSVACHIGPGSLAIAAEKVLEL